MSRTMTISSWPASKVTFRCSAGSSCRPEKISAYIRATRAGVSSKPSRLGVLADGDEDLAHGLLDAGLVDAVGPARVVHGSPVIELPR